MNAIWPRPVSGEQYFLSAGRYRAQIGQLAAVLRSFALVGADGEPVYFTEVWPDDLIAPMGCGIVLVPWPNRVAGAVWSHDGAIQKLDVTEPGRGNASHGLLRNTAYVPTAVADDLVELSAAIYPQHGYPFSLDTSVRYSLSEEGLTVTHTVANSGAARAPFGVGAHPYLRVGAVPAAELTLTVSAGTRAVVDSGLIPRSLAPVDADTDLRGGVVIDAVDLDTAFTDLELADGRYRHLLTAPSGSGLELWAEPDFGWVQVFTPPKFPGPGLPDQRKAVAVEPMTCAADAFNNGWGLLWVEPGEAWSASWGLRPLGFS